MYSLREHIGIVLQDVFLFSGTVYDNITLRNNAIPLEKVQECCTILGIHDFIMRLPDNYYFNVMERGNTLSQGQRQLISFARALLYNPTILILDEATSSIDSESAVSYTHLDVYKRQLFSLTASAGWAKVWSMICASRYFVKYFFRM